LKLFELWRSLRVTHDYGL